MLSRRIKANFDIEIKRYKYQSDEKNIALNLLKPCWNDKLECPKSKSLFEKEYCQNRKTRSNSKKTKVRQQATIENLDK